MTADEQSAARLVRALARGHAALAVQKLRELLDSPDERVVLSAAQQLLDRAVGKPQQSVDLSATIETQAKYDTSRLSTEQLHAVIAAAQTARVVSDSADN